MPLRKIIIILLSTLLLSPFLAYVYTVWLGLPKTITHLFTFFVFVFGIIYIFSKKNLIVPTFAKYLLIFAFYELIWNVIIGSEKHYLTVIFAQIRDFAVFFIMIIIYNSTYTERFIKNSILIMKITVVLAAIVSIIQVFNNDFLDANIYFTSDESIGNLYNIRRNSIFGFIFPASLGLAFIPLLSVLIGYMLHNNEKKYPLYLVLGGLVSFLSNTRFILVGFLLLSFQIMIFNKARIGGYLKYFFILVITLIILINFLRYIGYDLNDWYNQRLMVEGNIQGTTRL